jgi:hypothetical protein
MENSLNHISLQIEDIIMNTNDETKTSIENEETKINNQVSKQVVEAVIESILDSKIHGLNNVFRTKSKVVKLIWLMCFIACSSYCFHQIIVTVMAYFEFKSILKQV